MSAFYNEIDPYAAQWLRNLIAAGHIAPGEVDTRSIVDIRPDDLRGFTQCHFFAGVGVWSHALRLAGWPDGRPVWTGSCPCQPFSAAGKGGGFSDERHLWPAFFHLIEQCSPPIVLGEQVASKDGLAWLDLVRSDLEAAGYACGAVDTCAAGFGAPHIRQRLYWAGVGLADDRPSSDGLEDAMHAQRRQERIDGEVGPHWSDGRRPEAHREPGARGQVRWLEHLPSDGRIEGRPEPGGRSIAGGRGLADADGGDASAERQQPGGQHGQQQADDCAVGGLADVNCDGRLSRREVRSLRAEYDAEHGGAVVELAGTNGEVQSRRGIQRPGEGAGESAWPARKRSAGLCEIDGRQPGPTNGFWRDPDWLLCRDGKWRPVRSGTFPLAHGAPARVGRLRAYGNAINAEQARGFIEAVMEAA